MLQKSNTIKIASIFFLESNKEHYLKQVSRKSKLAHTSVKKILDELKKQGIIKEKTYTKGSRKFPVYFADTQNKKYLENKKILNLHNIYISGIIEYLNNKIMPSVIVLFGSYLRAEDTENSDIDLFIESKEENLDLHKFEKKLGRKIQCHFKENFNDYNPEIKNNIINGHVLSGYLEVFN